MLLFIPQERQIIKRQLLKKYPDHLGSDIQVIERIGQNNALLVNSKYTMEILVENIYDDCLFFMLHGRMYYLDGFWNPIETYLEIAGLEAPPMHIRRTRKSYSTNFKRIIVDLIEMGVKIGSYAILKRWQMKYSQPDEGLRFVA